MYWFLGGIVLQNGYFSNVLDSPPHKIVNCTVVLGQMIHPPQNNFAQIMNQEVKNEESSSEVYLGGRS